jgi:hypothetical protein
MIKPLVGAGSKPKTWRSARDGGLTSESILSATTTPILSRAGGRDTPGKIPRTLPSLTNYRMSLCAQNHYREDNALLIDQQRLRKAMSK